MAIEQMHKYSKQDFGVADTSRVTISYVYVLVSVRNEDITMTSLNDIE
jgi:hypothetical protein